MIRHIIIVIVFVLFIGCVNSTAEPRLDFTNEDTTNKSLKTVLEQGTDDERDKFSVGFIMFGLSHSENTSILIKDNLHGKTLKEAIQYLYYPNSSSKSTSDTINSKSISDININLSKRSIPELPVITECLGEHQSGLFAKYYFLAVKLEQKEICGYEENLKNDGAVINEIGEVKNGLVILSRGKEYKNLGKYFSLDCEIEYHETDKDKKEFKWWNLDEIKNGARYYKVLPNECRYKIYVDRGNNIIYIYWSYS